MSVASNASASLKLLASVPLRDAASRYLREHEGGSPLYPAGHLGSGAARTRRARKLDAWPGDRAALVTWLTSQNSVERLGSLYPAQSRNLAAAARPDAVFVLTGQQPGLLGGPALALHKALTAVAQARAAAAHFEETGAGRPVIPIFWAAGDDSDLAETNAAEFLEPSAAQAGMSTGAALVFDDPEDAIPMSLRFPSTEELDRLFNALPAVWSEETRARVQEAYKPGRSLTEGFLRLLQGLLGEEGLLFVDGFSAAGRAQGILGRVANASGDFHEALARGTKRLSEALNQSPQVPVRPGTVPVFLLENNRRERLFVSDSGRVYTAGAEARDLRPELLPNQSARALLHSALTRPLVVEELFPTLGHVLGPAELRYFAQIADVFPAFNLSSPLLAPREQMMVLPTSGWKALQDLGFSAEELFDLRPSLVRERLTEKAWQGHDAAKNFPEEAQSRFQAALKEYQARWLPGADFESSFRRLGRSFGHYREQARKRVFEQNGAEAFQALQPLLRWIGNGAQDRHLNALSLHNALGVEGFGALKKMLAEFNVIESQGRAHAVLWTDAP